ncbi:hypothetical protein V6N12_035548 [Hibiscus sabdariffa]|uniref:Retrotransposon gag domain-containing protein n=1 Tax=Hibiscus sabdariffa TaxID=183260 RepID=A0ABR2EN25_9ROSI
MRKRFLYLKQGNRPVEQYVAAFCKYCKYGSEYIQTGNLVNRAIATEANMKAAEKRGSSSHRNDKRPRTESKPQWQFKKPKSYRENSSTSVSVHKSNHLSRPQSVSRSPTPTISVNSTDNS